jgi:hypothetical protein
MKLPAKDAQAYFFYQVLSILNRTLVPFLMGGGFAFEFHTHTLGQKHEGYGYPRSPERPGQTL